MKTNIFGNKLIECQPGERYGGSQLLDGTCSELDGGVHQICVKQIGKGINFAKETGQSDWSTNRGSKNHCACLGAWANYVARGHNDKDLKCESIPSTALSREYISKWSNWNNVTIDNQYKEGINALYRICIQQAKNQDELDYMNELVKNMF
jgi:hypothetical protein